MSRGKIVVRDRSELVYLEPKIIGGVEVLVTPEAKTRELEERFRSKVPMSDKPPRSGRRTILRRSSE